MTPRHPPHHTVLLVGFMGSGKSTVGPLVATDLGWDFIDVDARVEARAGRNVEEIFERDGEPAFRELERRAAEEALAGRDRVVAPGGGWAVVPGRLESVGPEVLTVWLDVSAATAVERALRGGPPRPLLSVADPVGRAEELMEARRPFYRKARLHLDADASSPERLARDIVRTVRTGRATA